MRRFPSYPHVNIPKDLTIKRHKIDRLHVWAAFLAHPYLNMPREGMTLRQNEIDAIYSILKDNKVILRTLDCASSFRPYSRQKRSLIRKLVERNRSFAEAHDFAFVLKQEILNTLKTLAGNGVETIFIKSLTGIPLDSNNFDVIVKKDSITKARRILEDLGFVELEKLREYGWDGPPHKYFYRKICSGVVLSFHLHTEVAWVLRFVDEKELWNRIRKREIDGVRLGFPSPENHLLITVAHAFFENMCLKLSDLMYIAEDFHDVDEMDLDYMIDHTINDGWFEPFCAILRLAQYIYEFLFGAKLIDEATSRKFAERLGGSSSLEKELIDLFAKEQELPLNIPSRRVILAFIRKVFATPNVPLVRRSLKILSTSRSYVKRRLRREIPPFVVCFSGQDGTGKTKHAESLRNELVQRGICADYNWSRGIGFSIEPYLRMARLLILGSKVPKSSEYFSKRRILLRREPIRTLWACIMLADELLLSVIKVRIPSLLGRVVICDRYLLDILVDVRCEMGKDIGWVIRKCVKRLMPNPRIHFVLDSEPDEIMKRRMGVKRGLVECRRDHYLTYCCEERLTLVNTDRSFEQNREEVLSCFMKARYIGKD